MFDIKQKLLEKLKKLARKKESVRRRKFRRPSLRRSLFQRRSFISMDGMAVSVGFSREEADALFTSPLFSFSQNKHVALEEIQEMLGLNDEKLTSLFSLLEKADDGYVGFHFGIMNIEFQTSMYSGRFEDETGITVRVEVHEKETTQIAEYQFPCHSNKAAFKEKC